MQTTSTSVLALSGDLQRIDRLREVHNNYTALGTESIQERDALIKEADALYQRALEVEKELGKMWIRLDTLVMKNEAA